MTQNKERISNIAELNSLFLTLDDNGQNNALKVLRALQFAQATMGEDWNEKPAVGSLA